MRSHRRRDQVTVPRHEGPEVDDLELAAELGLHPLGGDERLLDHRAPGHHREVAAGPPDRAPAERDHVLGRRVRVARVRLAQEVLVLEEQHRVLAAERGAQQPDGVARRETGTR